MADRWPGRSRQQGTTVDSLSMRRDLPDPLAVFRLVELLRRQKPDLVVTWLDHSNVLGGLAARLAGGIPVVWNIRHCVPQRHNARRRTRLVGWLGARLSTRLPRQIVYVSQAVRGMHADVGFDDQRATVIPNGFDAHTFRPDPEARRAIRRELGLDADVQLVGLFGRFHPDKDHDNFVRAAARIHRDLPGVRFLLCGTDVDRHNRALESQLERAGVRGAFHLLGPREDMPRLSAGLDLLVSSSVSEAMPRVVGETMACGVPSVVTDVGDSALLVGRTGRVVPPGDDRALAAACLEVLRLPAAARSALGLAARQRIIHQYSLDEMVERHFGLWSAVAGRPIGRRGATASHPRLRAA